MADGWRNRLGNVMQNLADGVRPWLPEYFPVAWKLGLSISLLIVVGMALLGSIVLTSQMDRMQAQADRFGQLLATQLADTAREPLLADDHFTLQVLLNNMMRGSTLRGVALFSRDGTLVEAVGDHVQRFRPEAAQSITRWEAEEALSTYTVPVTVGELVAGHVTVTLSRQGILEAQRDAARTIVLATVLMTLVAIVLAFLVSRRLSSPIHQLLSAASAIQKGDLNYRIDERRNDEIGLLIDAYNTMAHGLLEKGQVERVLQRFVSPSVARRMMADLDQVSLGGREVKASVVFADIVGFTSLSETMSPDAVADMLNVYFDAISNAATFYRGTIDKYMGDCAMIVFGVPEEDPEHFYHGLCCAVMIQRLVARLNDWRAARELPTVQFRIGINAGEMLAGNLGSRDRMQYTVVGDAVNLASRLSNLAGGGEIVAPLALVSEPNICSRIQAERGEAVTLRGISEPIVTAKVTGVHAHSLSLMEQKIAAVLAELTEEPLRVHNA